MKSQFMFSGIGGQGIISSGELICSAAVKKDYVVTFVPFYGQEKRGGRTMCQIVVSEQMGSPIISSAELMLVMDNRSLKDYLPMVKPGGTLLTNSNMVTAPIDRTDLKVYQIPFNDIALEIGNAKCANMVALGSALHFLNFVTLDDVKSCLSEIFPGAKQKLVPLNERAIDAGYNAVQ